MTLLLRRVLCMIHNPLEIIPEIDNIKTAARMRGGCKIESENIAT
jgi:hypothetical protein